MGAVFCLAVFLRKTCIVQPLARHNAPFSRCPLRDFIIPNMRCFFVFYVCWKRFCFIILMLYICDIKYNIYMETIASDRKQTAFRLRKDLLERLKVEARKENRSLNNYVESVLMDVVYREPNDETLAAMKEAEEGKIT